MSQDRHKTNPFLTGMVVPIKGQQVKLSRLGEDENILINKSTGESQGTHVATFKKVDKEQFVKLFTANIGLTFGLTSAGIKALSVLIWAVQNKAISKDEIPLDTFVLNDFLAAQQPQPLKLSLQTFRRGITELGKAQIIAKTLRRGHYFINPNFMFNGDRIAFTTIIERSDSHNDDQQELDV